MTEISFQQDFVSKTTSCSLTPGDALAKNVVICSDTARPADRFDEDRSNVYKLYRAKRCRPDSSSIRSIVLWQTDRLQPMDERREEGRRSEACVSSYKSGKPLRFNSAFRYLLS